MASIIRIKRSEVSGNPGVLGAGELAYSALADNGSNGGDRLYIGMGTETGGNAVNHVVIGGKYFTDQILAATDSAAASTLVKRDASGSTSFISLSAQNITATGTVSAAEFGGAGVAYSATGNTVAKRDLNGSIEFNTVNATTLNVSGISAGPVSATTISASGNIETTGSIIAPQFQGDLSGTASYAGGFANPITLELYGDAAATFTGVQGFGQGYQAVITLSDVIAAGSAGSTTEIPVLTVDSKGRVTSLSTVGISTGLSYSTDSGSGTVALANESLTISGGTGVATRVTNSSVYIDIGQAVSPTSDVTFNNVTVSGSLYSDDITATNISVDGAVVITGNLTVQGTTTTVNSNVVEIADKNITLAKGSFTSAEADGAGITVEGAGATLTYTSIDDRWNLNKDLNVANVYGALKGNADTASKWSAQRLLAVYGDGSATLVVDGSQNVAAEFTLSQVNNNIGGFGYASVAQPGDAVTVPYFVVNGKGLITAASAKAIPMATTTTTGLAKFDGNQFTVTSGAVTLATIDGGTY
jgi:hypothetical protein